MTVNDQTRKNRLDERQLYMLMQIEKRIGKFESIDLMNARQNLERIERERLDAIATLNQVNGAIIGGRIMIEQELELAGVSPETYEAQKNSAAVEAGHAQKNETEAGDNLIKFPQGQDNETVSPIDDDSCGTERQ